MIKELKLKFPLFQTKFFEHQKLKKSLIDKINKSNYNDTNGLNDTIEKFDWNIAKDTNRDWVKEVIHPIYSQLNVFAQKMGYKRLTIKEIWFQKYIKNSVHNWHIHADNYTGVYYLKLPTNHTSCYTQFLYPDNLNKRFSLDTNEGDILFFPSFLIHRAPHLQSSQDKIIISWNCEFVGTSEKYTQERENTKIIKL